ncbi:hypothetical protein Tco_1289049 [Tanacetum coccineum]
MKVQNHVELQTIVVSTWSKGDLDNRPDVNLLKKLKAVKFAIKEWRKDLNQKAEVRWFKEGDANSILFHGYINGRKRQNRLHGLHIGGSWVTNPSLIKDEVFDFFSSKFAEDSFSRPALVSNFFKKLFDAQSSSLESPFSLEEIKITVWECGNDKSLGPDGFTFNFIKKFWDLHSHDINKFVMHFHETGTIHKGCNSSFISLLPKVR